MTALATPPLQNLRGDQLDSELASEVFTAKATFESEEQIQERMGAKSKRKGRLGRLNYEFTTADTLNQNRRIYPHDVFALALSGLEERIGRNVVFGNLDHPSIFDPESLTIMLSDAAVKVAEVKMTSDSDVRVVLDILDNEDGQRLRSVLDVGGNPGVSQRAIAAWREATDEERERFKIPEDEFVQVAEALRLITYDVVSEPGFADADGARVQDHKQGAVPMPLTLEALKTEHRDLYDQVVQIGVAQAEAGLPTKIEAAVEERKPALVTEALAPVNEQLAEAETQRDKALEVLISVKPALVELGIVNEKITDAEAAARVATAEGKVTLLESELETTKTALTAAEKKVEVFAAQGKAMETLKTVSAQYKTHPHHDAIITEVHAKGLTDPTEALEAAKRVAALIDKIAPVKQTDDTDDKDTTVAGGLESLLLHNTSAAPGAGSGGRTADEGKDPQAAAAAAIIGSDNAFML